MRRFGIASRLSVETSALREEHGVSLQPTSVSLGNDGGLANPALAIVLNRNEWRPP
jgi:hypothetical protein